MTYKIRPAKRSEAKPLIGLYSESGCGKTYTALLLARGYAGAGGKIVMIETESGRGEAYADPTEYPEIGGYDVISMRDNFSPTEYGKAITVAEKTNPDVLIIDSASHEWEGNGGVLSMAATNQANGKKGPIVWQQPKITHQREFMLRFMQTSIPLVILCMRAKYPMKEVPDPRKPGRKMWQRSDALQPKQADDILFEMFVHGWIDNKHNFHMSKCNAKMLEPVFGTGAPLSAQTGAELRKWASGDNKSENSAGAVSETTVPTHKPEESQQTTDGEATGGYQMLSAKGKPQTFPDLNGLHDFIVANLPHFKSIQQIDDFLKLNGNNFYEYSVDDPAQTMNKIYALLNNKKKELSDA